MCAESEIVRLTKNTRFFIGEEGFSNLTNMPTLKSISIWDINWRIRFSHALQNINKRVVIENLEQLLNTHFEEFMNLRNCGTTTIEQARQTIIKFLLSFNTKKDLENYEDILKEKNEKRTFVESYPLSERSEVPIESLKKHLTISLEEFEFPIRLKQYISRKNKISNLGELLSLDSNILINERNIGRKTIADISKIIRLERGIEKLGEKNIVVVINHVLSKISERELAILKMRWDGNDVTSMEEIGLRYKLTRERIRQILQRVVNKIWARLEVEAEYHRKKFLDYLINKPTPITEQVFNASSCDLLYHPRLYLGLLAEIFQEIPVYGFIPRAFDQYVARQIEKDPLWKNLCNILEKLKIGHNEISTQKLKKNLEAKKLSNSQQLLCFKILVGLKKYFFLQEGDKYYLLRKGGIRDMVYMILKNSKKPLKIEEILAIVHKYYYEGSKYHVLNSVIGNIKQDERIIQFDKYVFGVNTHFAYPKNQWKNICEVSKEFLKKEKRQCYITEILEEVRDNYPHIKSKYELVFILRKDLDIKDLGFFNFTLTSYGQEERIKVSDIIKDIFKKDPCVKHVFDIRGRLKENRFVHDQGMTSLLKSQKYLKSYLGGFYGLRSLDLENDMKLAGEERFLEYLINQHYFPTTDIKIVAEYFDSEELQQKAILTITTSKVFQIYTLENGVTCVINNNWSVFKKVKCLLSNINEAVFEEQLEWILKDLGINDFKKDLYRIRNDRSIMYTNNKYSFNETSRMTPELISLIDECYDFICDSSKPYYLQNIFELIGSSESQIEYNQFVYALKDDERFIVMDNNLVLIK